MKRLDCGHARVDGFKQQSVGTKLMWHLGLNDQLPDDSPEHLIALRQSRG